MTATCYQPLHTAPLDGRPVILVTRLRTSDTGDHDKRTPQPFVWNGKVWVSKASGLPLPGSVQVIGWDRWEP